MVLDQAARLSTDPKIRFAALVHDLGKALSPRESWPKHHGHEAASVQLIEALCERLKVPGDYRDLSLIVARYHGNVHRAFELRPATVLEMFEKSDAFRRAERFDQALLACEADSRGRLGLEERPYPQRQYLTEARDAAAAVKPSAELIAAGSGPKIAEALTRDRLNAIQAVRARQTPPQAS
jgi:tRNA nucleotidyltransferase (CCA-adding enzyme)